MSPSLHHLVYPRDNDALEINPPAGDRHITTTASDWLWFVFAVMLLTWLSSLVWQGISRRRNRTLHDIPVIVLATATLAYFAMASDLGFTLIRAEFGTQPTRQIWFVRYIQWFINAPLILLAVLSFTGMSTADILTTLFFAWFLVVSGLVGALVHSSYKWGFFTFGLFGLFFIWFRLLGYAPMWTFRRPEFRTPYFIGAGFISFIWMFYPICWALSEGSDLISPTSEMVFYGVLDLLTGPVFLIFYMFHLGRYDFEALAPTALGTADRGLVEGARVADKGPQPMTAPPAQPPAAAPDAGAGANAGPPQAA